MFENDDSGSAEMYQWIKLCSVMLTVSGTDGDFHFAIICMNAPSKRSCRLNYCSVPTIYQQCF